MTRVAHAAIAITIAVGSPLVRADDATPPPEGGREPIDRIRELYEQGDYAGVRGELLKQYEVTPKPELLFALGQVELQLGNAQAAIDYYERFIASGPSEEQIALAQQAIGAARMRLSQPPPEPREPVYGPPRRWVASDTILVAAGGAAIAGGVALFAYGRHLANDRSGTLAEYDDRYATAQLSQGSAIGIAAIGGLLIGATILRWRLRPDRPLVTAGVTADGGSLAASWTW